MVNKLSKNKIHIEKIFKENYELFSSIYRDENIKNKIEEATEIICSALYDGKKVLFFGNGGSAADAQHMAGEFVSKFMFDRDSLPGIALTTDSSIITAVANDYGFEYIFSRQIEAIAREGDVAFAYSTSGKSKNVLNALETAERKGLHTIGLTGIEVEDMNKYCEILIKIPSKTVPRIQEGHLLVGHVISELVELKIFK